MLIKSENMKTEKPLFCLLVLIKQIEVKIMNSAKPTRQTIISLFVNSDLGGNGFRLFVVSGAWETVSNIIKLWKIFNSIKEVSELKINKKDRKCG